MVLEKGSIYIYYKDIKNEKIEMKNFKDVISGLRTSEQKQEPVNPRGLFFEEYEKIKGFCETGKCPIKELSTENKEINNLISLLRENNNDDLMPHNTFVRMLLEDILDYGALSDYTLRRISNIDLQIISIEGMRRLKEELVDDYLKREKKKLKDMKKEISITVENRQS